MSSVMQTLKRFATMRADGDTVDPTLKAKIERYMRKITHHLLQTCVSYEQWTDHDAIEDEMKAVHSGNPEGLSGLHPGSHLSSSKVVGRFLQAERKRVSHAYKLHPVPVSLQHLMTSGEALIAILIMYCNICVGTTGVILPGVGQLTISMP